VGFFAEFNTWLNAVLTGYIGTTTATIAGALEPAIVTLGVVYVMVWGYLQLTGQIQEAFIGGLKKIIVLAVILGCSLNLWLYNSLIVDTFFNAPVQLGAVIVGAYDPVGIIDQVFYNGSDIANLLFAKAGFFDGNFAYYLAGAGVYAVVIITGIYAVFLLTLSRIALSVLLALGPLFIALLFFESSKRFFEAWLAQLANYALVSILTVLVTALMLHVVTVAAQQAVATGGGIQIANAVRVCMAAGLTFLVMRQVMPMAAGLASGLALSTFGVVSAALAWGFGGALRARRNFGKSFRSASGQGAGSASYLGGVAVRRALTRLASTPWRENTIRRRA
jgi:type IV secretion system protein VirB6